MKTLIALFLIVLMAGCFKDAQEKKSTSNSAFEVEFLFEIDGCKIYRFVDGGYTRYFTTCKNASTSWTEKHGKTSHPQSIETK